MAHEIQVASARIRNDGTSLVVKSNAYNKSDPGIGE